MTALTFWLALMVVQVPSSPRTFVETSTFRHRAACEKFLELTRPALVEDAKVIVYRCLPLDVTVDVREP